MDGFALAVGEVLRETRVLRADNVRTLAFVDRANHVRKSAAWRTLCLLLVLQCLITPLCLASQAKAQQSLHLGHELRKAMRVPISFEVNVGQIEPNVRYVERNPHYDLFLKSSEAVFKLTTPGQGTNADCGSRVGKPAPRAMGASPVPNALQCLNDSSSATLRLHLVGTTHNVSPEGVKPVASYSNYLIGNDPRKWRMHVPHFAEVWYPSVYPGVDLVYHGNDGRLEYDFVVAPHARADRIAFSIDGIDTKSHLRQDANGDLVISVGEQHMLVQKPQLYQGQSCLKDVGHDTCHAIDGGEFVVRQLSSAETQISFALPRYDHSQTLVIDPVVAFSTFLGAGGGPEAMTLDSAGNIYMVGSTASTTLPVSADAFQKNLAGNSNLFIMKLNNDASEILYATYLGGSSTDYAGGIALDSAGSIYVTGQTYSTDFPLMHPFQSQNSSASAFLSKLSPDGSSLVYSTYLGGSPPTSSANGIAVDASDEATIVGYTYDTNFPTVNAFQPQHANDNGDTDAFVTKFAADGASLVFSTYLGGNSGDLSAGLTLDPSGNIYLTGITASSDFPVTPGAYQTTPSSTPGAGNSFLSEFSPTGSIVYSTYVPGGQTTAIAVNSSGNAFVTGSASKALPVTAGAFQTSEVGADAFVTEFNSTGSGLIYSTFLGGDDVDTANAIALDSSNNVYVTGQTSSLNFPLKLPVQTTLYSGVPDSFVSELNSTGSALLFSTFLGGGAETGSGSQQGTAIAVDSAGNIYVGGGTDEPDFPIVNAFVPTLNGFADGFLAKFVNEPAPAVGLNPTSISFSPVVVNSVSTPQTITVTNVGTAPLSVSAITASGGFSQSNNCGSAIAVNSSCSIQATFAPTFYASIAGTISIASNATLFPEVVQLSGTGQDFIFEGTPGIATVSPGQSAAVSLSLEPEGGFAQQVSLSCSGAPPGSTCTVSPSTVTLNGTATVNATATIITTGPSSAFRFPGYTAPIDGLLCLSLLGLFLGAVGAKNRWAIRTAVATILVLGLFTGACGGGGGGGGGTTTPGGSYNIIITAASGSDSHSLEFSLTVN